MKRPVILLGEGARGADLSRILDFGIPILTSWQACDLIDNWHAHYFGRPGVFGQRCANKVLYRADHVISIGCRMSVWTTGYTGLRPDQGLEMVDCDDAELLRFGAQTHLRTTAAEYCAGAKRPQGDFAAWLRQCMAWRLAYPWLEAAHASREKLNAYGVVDQMRRFLRADEVIVTDMGVALCAAFQVLPVRPPQQLFTSGGLGEMGCALPFAIGASFARGRGEVLCLSTDGGMMLNLAELQTIVHHNLPVKLVVFSNDGYVMLKNTERNFGMPYAGVDKASGVSCPDFRKLGYALGIRSAEVHGWQDFETVMPQFFAHDGPALVEIHCDPEQALAPKLQPIIALDGTIRSPAFEELSPVIEQPRVGCGDEGLE